MFINFIAWQFLVIELAVSVGISYIICLWCNDFAAFRFFKSLNNLESLSKQAKPLFQ